MTDTLRRPARDTSKPDMEAILEEHGNRILRLCLLYLGNRTLAEDAFQETMLRCWQHYDTYSGNAPFAAWLRKIAVNVCHDIMRKGWFRIWKKSDPEDQVYDLAAEEPSSDTDVRDAVAALPGIYREMIVLYYFENLSTTEIAQALSLPKGTVSTRLQRARSMMKKKLEEDETHAR